MPPTVYSLLPITSPFHPSNTRTTKSSKSASAVDFSISSNDSDGDARWYETVDLTLLRAASNELEELDRAIGGFGELQTLDVHNNRIASLPVSIGLLSSTLTTLNLSSNALTTIPLALLALDSLRELDLSHNSIASLWPAADWRAQVTALLDEERATNEMLAVDPDSSAEDFWSSFPSSPSKPKRDNNRTNAVAPATERGGGDEPPWPALRSLNLSSNKLRSATISNTRFPASSLRSLHLARNHLFEPIRLLGGRFPDLVELDLASNEFADRVFEGEAVVEIPALGKLGLENNALDVLEGVENVFRGKKAIKYVGAPSSVLGLNREEEEGDEEEGLGVGVVEVRVAGNMLRGEVRRRRAAAAEAMRAKRVADAEAAAAERSRARAAQVRVEEDEGDDGGAAEAVSAVDLNSSATAPTSSSSSNDIVPSSSADPALLEETLLKPHFDAPSSTLRLSSLSLTSFPPPQPASSSSSLPPPFEPPPKTIDLGRNAITSVNQVLTSLEAWRFSSTLRVLNFSRNRLAANLFLDAASSSSFVLLEALTELDLSSNRLVDAQLADLARMAPELKILDLSYNALETISGVSDLLIGPPDVAHRDDADDNDNDDDADDDVGRQGVQVLRLVGNRLGDVDEIARIGERFYQRRRKPRVAGGGVRGWRCTELAIAENDLAKVRTPHSTHTHPGGKGLIDVDDVTFFSCRRCWGSCRSKSCQWVAIGSGYPTGACTSREGPRRCSNGSGIGWWGIDLKPIGEKKLWEIL
jgi:Leucine-rich repeat (LRR) protein